VREELAQRNGAAKKGPQKEGTFSIGAAKMGIYRKWGRGSGLSRTRKEKAKKLGELLA
jgi:hypothetical protein